MISYGSAEVDFYTKGLLMIYPYFFFLVHTYLWRHHTRTWVHGTLAREGKMWPFLPSSCHDTIRCGRRDEVGGMLAAITSDLSLRLLLCHYLFLRTVSRASILISPGAGKNAHPYQPPCKSIAISVRTRGATRCLKASFLRP